ncbi:hypothetical protein M5F00_09430 [Acinetobacter sp. ANC 4945]|nr:hypothetical protein [Acinetobacter amyesii]MCL6248083.1 hypothetical protein [Acinetobacter amyesii]
MKTKLTIALLLAISITSCQMQHTEVLKVDTDNPPTLGFLLLPVLLD